MRNVKKIIFGCCFYLFIIVLKSSGGKPSSPIWEQENVDFIMMNQEIKNAMEEGDRQNNMFNEQTIATAGEIAQKEQMSQFKRTTIAIQDRLRKLDFAIQALPSGQEIAKYSNRIKRNQEAILREIKTAPYAIVQALPLQIHFVDELQMNVRLLAGIVASYGAINQMEKAERLQMINYVVDEIKDLYIASNAVLWKIKLVKEKVENTKYRIKGYINKDKNIVNSIIRNIKTF